MAGKIPEPHETTASDSTNAERPPRALFGAFAVVMAFAAAVMIGAVAIDLSNSPICSEAGREVPIPADNECFDGSSGAKSASVGLAWASGVVGALAALLAGLVALTGLVRGPIVALAGIAIALGLASILVGIV